MVTTFEICELYIYFGFIKNDLSNNELNEIYENYKCNINKNNEKIAKYIFDITNYSYSDVTFDSGFDIFNVNNQNILGKQTSLVDFNINCCMKSKKYGVDNKTYIDFDNRNTKIDYNFTLTSGLNSYISHLTNNLNLKLVKTFETYSGYYLYPRSSMGTKTPLRCANSVGIIDSGYRGTIKGCLYNISEMGFELIKGDRYMQICPGNISSPIYITEVNSLEELGYSERGSGGFGSTGK